MLCATVVSSCNDDDDNVVDTTQNKIQHVWGVDSVTIRTVNGLIDNTIKADGGPNDKYDFRADGNLYFKLGLLTDTVPYKVINSEKILIDGDTTTITTLTSTKFVAYKKDMTSPTEYVITTGYLRR